MPADARATARLSRRGLLGVSAAGATALLGGCGGGGRASSRVGAGPAAADVPGSSAADVDILNVALGLESLQVAAYRRALPHLDGGVAVVARRFLAQERTHADALAAAIERLGGTPARGRQPAPLPAATDRAGALELALRVEQMAIGAYLDAIPKLADAGLRARAASILTVEAEHVAVLRGALGRSPTPEAFVTGNP